MGRVPTADALSVELHRPCGDLVEEHGSLAVETGLRGAGTELRWSLGRAQCDRGGARV